ncbi:MAG: AEC family transporter, partial [Anaerolineales bacterium]|nr:AEC family transporter [Anaerolineales bacterium]
ILLGMQIARVGLPKRGKLVILTAGLKLLVAPLIAWLIASFMGMSGVSRQAGILQSAMPTAVTTIVLATEFDVEPEFVTAAVFITTLISPLTITPILAILGV